MSATKKLNLAFSIYFSVIVFIIVIAYKGMIPVFISNIPFYDKIGHFFLIGFFSYLDNIIMDRKKVKFGNLNLPLAPIIVLTVFIIEEFFQMLSPVRTFDVTDILSDILGVYFFYKFDKHFPILSNKHSYK